MAGGNGFTVRDVTGERYEILDGTVVAGAAHYLDVPAARERILYHTVVDDAFAGRGAGSALARAAVDGTVAAGLTVVPVCPFVKAWLRRHPEFAGVTGVVRPEHLAAVTRR
ncbi:N-acetyltransferase [Kineococcus sp. NUM-3379]